MKVPLFWVVIIVGLSVCADGIVDDLLEADCPDAVVDTVYVGPYGIMPEGDTLNWYIHSLHTQHKRDTDSIAVLNERLEKQQATLNHWDTAGSPSFRHLERELCSGMVSMAALESMIHACVDTVFWYGAEPALDVRVYDLLDALDSLKQARGL